MAFDPQDYDVKPIGDAGLTERTSLDGSERILVQAGADADVNTTPMQFFRWSMIKNLLSQLRSEIDAIELSLDGLGNDLVSQDNSIATLQTNLSLLQGSVSNLISNGKSGIDTRTSFPPSLHVHGKLDMPSDSRSVETFPNDYNKELKFPGLKYASTIGLSGVGSYVYLVGLRGWGDISGGHSHEIAFSNNGIYVRIGTSETAWGAWKTLITY